jgi:hypothetical protein
VAPTPLHGDGCVSPAWRRRVSSGTRVRPRIAGRPLHLAHTVAGTRRARMFWPRRSSSASGILMGLRDDLDGHAHGVSAPSRAAPVGRYGGGVSPPPPTTARPACGCSAPGELPFARERARG